MASLALPFLLLSIAGGSQDDPDSRAVTIDFLPAPLVIAGFLWYCGFWLCTIYWTVQPVTAAEHQ